MLECSFSVRHEGCWTADINDAFPDITATILQSFALSDSSPTVIEVADIDGATASEIVEWGETHPVITKSDLVAHDESTGIISFQTDYSDTDTEPVGTVFRERTCIPLSLAEIRGGYEYCNVLMASKDQVRETYEALTEYGPVEVRTIVERESNYQVADLAAVSRAVTELSPRQRQVLKRAIEHDYYSVPQGCDLEDLAGMDSATMSTVAEHLRHAENKIFDAIEPLLASESIQADKKPR